MNIDAANTSQINLWPKRSQKKVKRELEHLYVEAFPKLPQNQRELFVEDYFKQPCGSLTRDVFWFRNKLNTLIAAAVFDHGTLNCNGNAIKGIYSITRAVLPNHQGFGIGKTIAVKIFKDYKPDILFATCAQSASLYSWIGLLEKGIINGYDVYPRIETNGDRKLIYLPCKDKDFVINAFKQIYMGVAEGKNRIINECAINLTKQMVRKNIYKNLFNHDPWKKNGSVDALANALDLTEKDGVLVIFIKNGAIR